MKQCRFRFALYATIFLVSIMAAVPTFASQARIVRLSQIEGDVQIDRGGTGLEKAILNMPVIEGTRIVAGDDATVEIEFENGGTMRMVGPAIVNFRELSLRSEGDKVTLVDLQPGIYYFDLKHKGDDDFRIGIAENSLKLKKNSHFRIDGSDSDVKVAVFKGELDLEGTDREVAIKSNETLTLDSSDAGRYFLAKGTDSLFSDSWDKERDQYREQYAKSETWKYANNEYGSPYSYGFSDLNQYGSYFNAPGYGWVWRPASYGMNWDPFSNGAWSYYPGQGWMFVSMYPWGWAPYRYGQWAWVPNYGWCWRPGGRYHHWNPVPVVRNTPPGTWRRPVPPSTNTRRTVFVNPAPTVPNGPTHTWRRPVPTPTTQGLVNGGTTSTPVVDSGRRTGGTWNRGVKEELRNDQPNTIPAIRNPDSDERRGTWRRVTPPEQVRPTQSQATPTQASQPAAVPQRTVTPQPQRQAEPRQPRPSAPSHVDRVPAAERGTWSRPTPSTPAPSAPAPSHAPQGGGRHK
jgi:hypothetical protein